MSRPPRTLEQFWYQRLKEHGFEDIEDTGREDRPLKSWQSWQFTEESRSQRRARNEEYQSLIEDFLHRPDFDEYCRLVVQGVDPGQQGKRYRGCKPGQPPLSVFDVRKAWEFHCEGLTEREIAQKLSRSKTGVHKCLSRMKAWMRLA